MTSSIIIIIIIIIIMLKIIIIIKILTIVNFGHFSLQNWLFIAIV